MFENFDPKIGVFTRYASTDAKIERIDRKINEMMIVDEYIKEYFKNGGKTHRIESIDSLRDGGTITVTTDKDVFYMDKESNTIHSGYPTDESNKISDSGFFYYMCEVIDSYVQRQHHKWQKSLKVLEQFRYEAESNRK